MSAPYHIPKWPPEEFETAAQAIAEDRLRADGLARAAALTVAMTRNDDAALRCLRNRCSDTMHLDVPRIDPLAGC